MKIEFMREISFNGIIFIVRKIVYCEVYLLLSVVVVRRKGDFFGSFGEVGDEEGLKEGCGEEEEKEEVKEEEEDEG